MAAWTIRCLPGSFSACRRISCKSRPTSSFPRWCRGELFVLNYLATHETAIHPKELSKKMAVSTARITSLLHHMEEKGLIARSSDLSDNRQIFVRLTGNGVTAIQKTRAEVISRVSSLLEALGPEDAREYIRIQEKILDNFLGNS